MLKACEECDNEISDKAFACPNCGNPNLDIKNRISQLVKKGKHHLGEARIPDKFFQAKKELVKKSNESKIKLEALLTEIKEASDKEENKFKSIHEFNAHQDSTPCSRCGSNYNDKPKLLESATNKQLVDMQKSSSKKDWCWICIQGKSPDQLQQKFQEDKKNKRFDQAINSIVGIFRWVVGIAFCLILLSVCSGGSDPSQYMGNDDPVCLIC